MTVVDWAAIPWAELFPCPQMLIVSVLSPVLGFWYGFRHPERY